MSIGSKFLKVTALASALFTTGCDFEKMAQEEQQQQADRTRVVNNTYISGDQHIASLEDGIHKIRIPASLSLDDEDKVKIILKDDFGRRAYVFDLGEFPDDAENTSSKIETEVIKEGNFIDYSSQEDGVKSIKIDADIFPDCQAREFLIGQDHIGSRAYPIVLQSRVVNDDVAKLDL